MHCYGILRIVDWSLRISVLGQPIGPISKGQTVLVYGITILLYVKSQKSADLIYIVAEDCNH